MQNLYYKINDFKIKLSTPEKIELHKLQSQIPGIELEDDLQIDLDLHFIFLEGNKYEIVQSDKKMVLYGKWSENVKADIPHLLYCVLRNYWVENEQYPVHSIMFKNSLLIGHSGSGKTTLALEALEQNIEVQSYDKTVVKFTNKKLMMVAGTNVISIRKKLFKQDFSLFKDKEFKDIGDRVLIEGKSFINMNKKNIKKLYFFSLVDSDFCVNKLSSLSSMHELYSFFLDSTKIDVIIDGGKFIYNGCNSTNSKVALVGYLENWLSKGNFVEMLIGRKQDIVKYIKNNKVD
jgi:hypothetical protein